MYKVLQNMIYVYTCIFMPKEYMIYVINHIFNSKLGRGHRKVQATAKYRPNNTLKRHFDLKYEVRSTSERKTIRRFRVEFAVDMII